MLLELEIQRERREGKAEGKAEVILEFLEMLGEVSADLRTKVTSETNLEVLKQWVMIAAKAASVDEFSKAINNHVGRRSVCQSLFYFYSKIQADSGQLSRNKCRGIL